MTNSNCKSTQTKRKSAEQATLISSKKLRSKLPRRRRSNLSPIIVFSLAKPSSLGSKSTSLAFSLNSTCCDEEFSCNISATRCSAERTEANDPYVRLTRSRSKQRANACSKGINGVEFEISENSCVESCSVVIEAESELQSKSVGKAVIDGSEVPARSVEGKFSKIGGEKAKDSVTISENCGGEGELQLSEITESCTNVNSSVLNSSSTIEQKASRFVVDNIDLACPEQFSVDDSEDDLEVSSATLSELQSEIVVGDSERDFSEDYSPSLWLDTGSQFSEKSTGDSTPSLCFSLFKQYGQQLSNRRSACDHDASSRDEEEYCDDVTFWKFEDDEEEECYRRLRSRERKLLEVVDYADNEYDSTTEYGSMILDQRTLMVNWIIETSHKKKLHDETMFLGVHLLDRFLSKAFFKIRRNIELLGISCLTLATRIEEKQPYNNILQTTFSVGSNVYSKSEAVAMEWVLQEVLKFRCLLPTLYNFMGFYLKAANADEAMKHKAKCLAELALRDNRQLRFWPSTVAAGLVILVSLAANREGSCQHVMETHIRTKVDDLPECLKSLEWLVRYAC
ncbi:hypothetical protein Dimus_014574 [Dionaea muscipula]